jgi:hypothetical protein
MMQLSPRGWRFTLFGARCEQTSAAINIYGATLNLFFVLGSFFFAGFSSFISVIGTFVFYIMRQIKLKLCV